MASKENLSVAINNVLNTIRKEKEREKVDVELFANNCIKEFMELDLPFYSIKVDEEDSNVVRIEVPFLKECRIEIEQYLFGSSEKCATLYINRKAMRKVQLVDKNPEYMARVANALLDYLKRYIILKNKF
jgi:hypothetical protein